MSTHRQLLHVSRQTSGSAGAHRAPSTWAVRAWLARAILVLALVLGGLGAVAASPGHHSAGHPHAIAHQPADNPAPSAGADSMSFGYVRSMPWMY
jgi:hypothetical protein